MGFIFGSNNSLRLRVIFFFKEINMDNRLEFGRDPCPWRIVDDMGGAFAMGFGVGFINSVFKGIKNSPRGERISGIASAVKARAPVMGGHFAAWGLTFSTLDCSISAIRKREDAWNSILSGGLTGGLLAIRGGPAASITSAVMGAIILGFLEGINILVVRSASEQYRPVKKDPPPSTENSSQQNQYYA
jgi:import inner membrane translocase subunit TIM17